MRLIDADALCRKVKTECNPYGKPTIGFEDGKRVMEWIECSPTVSGWVSVKDRLPDDTKQKIVFHKRGVSFGHLVGEQWWSSIGGRHGLDTVTHWMPLPEPPEEEKE